MPAHRYSSCRPSSRGQGPQPQAQAPAAILPQAIVNLNPTQSESDRIGFQVDISPVGDAGWGDTGTGGRTRGDRLEAFRVPADFNP